MQQHKNGDAPHQDAATAVSHFHTHSVPLDMEDIRRDWDKPISEAGLAAKTSVVVRVGALDLGAGTGSFRVREMMHRIAYPLGVHVRADVNLTDIEATCTDDANRITEVIDLPTTGVNTERIWLLEHYTDWFSVNLGLDSMYHRAGDVSEGVVQNLEQSDMSEVSAQLAKKLRAEKKAQKELSGEASDDPVLDALEAAEVTVPVSMVARPRPTSPRKVRRTTSCAPKSEAALKEDREAKLLHDRLMQQRSGKHDFVETPDLDAAAAAAGGAGAGASSAEDQNLNEFGTSMSAEALLGAKRRKTRAHKPLTGEYAEHFDHVGRSAGEGRKTITVRQAHERLDLIESRKPLYSPAFAGFASAVACASFVFLLGGGPYDMIGAFVGAGLGHWLRRKLFARHLNQFFVTFVCVALAALACTGTLRLIGLLDPIALTHDTAYIGAMLFVIPGFPLITGGLDMAKIDFPSGIQRVAYVLCIILMATLAGWGVAMIVHLNPTGFEPLGLNPWVNTGLLGRHRLPRRVGLLDHVQFAAAHVPGRRHHRHDHRHAATDAGRFRGAGRGRGVHRRAAGRSARCRMAHRRAQRPAAAASGLSAHLPDRAVHRHHGARSVYVPGDVLPRTVRYAARAGLGVPSVHGDYLPADRFGDGPRDHR